MCQAGPRWRQNREIAWYIERLLLRVRYTNSKRSPSSNAISKRTTCLSNLEIIELKKFLRQPNLAVLEIFFFYPVIYKLDRM